MSKLFEVDGQTIFPLFDEKGQIEAYLSYPIPDGPLPEKYDDSKAIPRTVEEFEAELEQLAVK